MNKRHAIVSIIVLVFSITTIAQERAIQPRERAIIHTGPGETFAEVGRLAWQDEITVIERNRAGTWVRVHVPRRGDVLIDGWVLTGYLIFDSTFRFAAVPINHTIPDADPTTVRSQSLSELYGVPVLPHIDDAMLVVYERGQQRGNHSHIVTKIGDSLMASPIYLSPINTNAHRLHPYTHLHEIVAYYDSPETSVAAQIGLSSFAAFDPMWADPERCEPGETPLDCELRLTRPVMAMIMFGPNDVRAMDDTAYEAEMRRIIETTLDHDVIPVLFTFSAHPDADLWWQSINFNLVLAALAEDYRVPLVNLWAAARVLPVYGLDQDRIHLMHSGFDNFVYETGHDVYYGVSLHNLLTLSVLYELHTRLHIEPAAEIIMRVIRPMDCCG